MDAGVLSDIVGIRQTPLRAWGLAVLRVVGSSRALLLGLDATVTWAKTSNIARFVRKAVSILPTWDEFALPCFGLFRWSK